MMHSPQFWWNLCNQQHYLEAVPQCGCSWWNLFSKPSKIVVDTFIFQLISDNGEMYGAVPIIVSEFKSVLNIKFLSHTALHLT